MPPKLASEFAPEFAKVSVIIPAYQAANVIARSLASVAAQILKPSEVIVVDDGSDDGTYEAAQFFAPRMNGIALKVFRQPNQGAGAARNRALTLSTQPIIAFLDADDEWLPEKLARSLFHLASGDYQLVAHNGWMVENGRQSLIDGASRLRAGSSPFACLYRKGVLDTCTVVTTRQALFDAGGFDPGLRNGQDFEMWLALLREPGARFLLFDEPLSCYHVTKGGIMSHTGRRLECCLEIARRYALDLKKHPGSAIISLWYRIIALHYEAVLAYARGRRFLAILMTLLKLPWRMFRLTLHFMFAKPLSRKNFLQP